MTMPTLVNARSRTNRINLSFLVFALLLAASNAFSTSPQVRLGHGQQALNNNKQYAPRIHANGNVVSLNAQDRKDNNINNNINNNNDERTASRRQVLATGIAFGALMPITAARPAQAATAVTAPDPNASVYKPAKRPTAYRVDSTTPPTLLPLDATKETRLLIDLGRGSGTDKGKIVVDTVNLNNILNKAVFGTVAAVQQLVNPQRDDSKVGPGYASFVCLGVPFRTTPTDLELAQSLMETILQPRNSKKVDTALGIACFPISTQAALDAYTGSVTTTSASTTTSVDELTQALTAAGLSEATAQLYLPLLAYAKSQALDILALAPEIQDVQAVRAQGLQNIDPARRDQYVADTAGFIALPQDPKFKMYTDRSLLKDYEPLESSKDSPGNFFAERILVHEAAATVAARYAVQRPECLVTIVAPTPDVRFLSGMNGRIPRVCAFLNAAETKNINKVTNNAVTTILLNPTAAETLSKSRFLRLEIGTGPETLKYQSKVADYLWFSAIPKVNLIPRLMDGQ